MSKFENVTTNGGANQFGDNNTQNNTTNHHHHNNGQRPTNGGEAGALAIGAFSILTALTWWFFGHIDQIHHYLSILTLSSGTLSAAALVIVMGRGEIEKEDIFRFVGSAIFALGLFGLTLLSREHAPNDVIQLSQHTKFMEFWQGLTDHGRALVLSNFLAAILIALSGFIAHMASIRQFSYSMANPSESGFWFGLYKATNMFKMRVSSAAILIFSGLAWAALMGKIPGIN